MSNSMTHPRDIPFTAALIEDPAAAPNIKIDGAAHVARLVQIHGPSVLITAHVTVGDGPGLYRDLLHLDHRTEQELHDRVSECAVNALVSMVQAGVITAYDEADIQALRDTIHEAVAQT